MTSHKSNDHSSIPDKKIYFSLQTQYQKFSMFILSTVKLLQEDYRPFLSQVVSELGVDGWWSGWVGVFSPLHLRTETDPVSETSCFLFSRIPDDGNVHKLSNSVCYTPSSEPFRICLRKDVYETLLEHHAAMDYPTFVFSYLLTSAMLILRHCEPRVIYMCLLLPMERCSWRLVWSSHHRRLSLIRTS
jgi:hypothetical protein